MKFRSPYGVVFANWNNCLSQKNVIVSSLQDFFLSYARNMQMTEYATVSFLLFFLLFKKAWKIPKTLFLKYKIRKTYIYLLNRTQ